MRLRRKNSLQASKLHRSVRSSALRSHGSKVRTPSPTSDSPETLTKRGKISRVSERSIHKIASPRINSAEDDEKEEGDGLLVNRRMTRAMDGEEPNKSMTTDAARSMRSKDFGGEKLRNKDIEGKFKNKASKGAGLKSRVSPASVPADHRDVDNTLYRKKLRYQEQNSTENGYYKQQGMAPDDPRIFENDIYRLTRSDMSDNNYWNGTSDSPNKSGELGHVPLIQDPTKLSQARAVLKSLRRQQRVPLAGGVTTRHKASAMTHLEPPSFVDRESELNRSPKSRHSKKNIKGGGLGNVHSAKWQASGELSAEAKRKQGPWHHADWPPRNGAIVNASPLNNRILTRTGKTQQEHFPREKGKSEWGSHKTSQLGNTQTAYAFVDCAPSQRRKVKKSGKGGGKGSRFLQRWKKRRTINRLGDSENANTNKASLHLITSPQKASQNLKDSVVTPRRSKRNWKLDASNDWEAIPKMRSSLSKNTKPLENLLQVRGQTGDVAVQDTFCLKSISSSIEHLQGNDTAIEKGIATENEMGSNMDVSKISPLCKSCLVATNPTETGGRQMRPRPLDLEQPLLVLVEGSNQDYYEFDGGSFYRMLQQQPEFKSPSISKMKSNGSNRRTVEVLDASGDKAEPILIPSFRSQAEFKDDKQNSGLPYVLPDSYIKTSSGIQNLQAEYDMDDEDEEWLNIYNQSVPPTSRLSADQFEKIIDLLENKAADVNGYNSITEAFEEDQEPALEECCICNGGENSDNNLVYQCSSCHILVHQSCYGIQKAGRNMKRKRNWNCRKCEAVFEGEENADLSCSLCCKQGGALKPSTELHKWAHVVCALYTNETYFVNPDAMEPIDGLEEADARAKRQRRRCWLCGVREGSVERCSVSGCKSLFHVSCGVTQGASFELQHSNHQVISVRVYCPKHALSALGLVKLEPKEQGENENEIEKPDEENENSKFNKLVDHEDLSAVSNKISSYGHWTRRGQKRNSLGQHRVSSEGVSEVYGKGILEDGIHLDSCRDQECTDASLKGEKTSKLAKKSRAQSEGVSGEKACATPISDGMLGIGNADAGLMEGVYLYWVCKRARQGGALLHHIQQEHAARQFNIFNSDDDVGPATPPEESFPRHGVIDTKVVAARQQLQRLQELTLLVVRRERLKLDIFLLEQNILKFALAALEATNTSQRCLLCKETHFSLVCVVCSRSTCLHCLLRSRTDSRCKSWLDYLKLPKYVCLDCEKDYIQTHGELPCILSVDGDDDCLAGSWIVCALKKAFGCDKMMENCLISSCKRPLILLPLSDVTQQDKSAMEVFWEQSEHKMALISDLLKNPL